MGQTAEAGLREYELIFVLRPNVDNAEAERVNGKIGEVVESFGGKLTKLDNWGRRRLAYPIQKHSRGLFVYAKYLGAGGVVAEVERTLRITDSVIRQQTVLLRQGVDATEEVDPEELQFAPVEEAEPEEEIALEQRLGLVTPPRPPRPDSDSYDRGDEDDEASASESGDELEESGAESSENTEATESAVAKEGADA